MQQQPISSFFPSRKRSSDAVAEQDDQQNKRPKIDLAANKFAGVTKPNNVSNNKTKFIVPSVANKDQQNTPTKVGLPDYLQENLDLILIGDNPGLKSFSNQTWYAHDTNHFWPLLFDSGLLPVKLTTKEDHKLNEYGLGVTCLCQRATSSTAELADDEWKQGYQQLLQKLEKYKPKAVCFNGKGIYESATGRPCNKLGLQPQPIVLSDKTNIKVFVVPSTSARVKLYSYDQKLNFFKEICKTVKEGKNDTMAANNITNASN